MKKFLAVTLALLCVSLMLTACVAAEPDTAVNEDTPISRPESDVDTAAASSQDQIGPVRTEGEENEKEPIDMAKKMNVQVGTYTFTATLEDNDAVQELVEMMQAGPVTINMSDYAGFEKVGPLGRSLTASNSQTTTTAGDIVLYNGDNIVMFYGSNSWSYTRIGKIDDLTDWTAALGSGDVTAIFTLP